jgi:putative ABC transport system permease protein
VVFLAAAGFLLSYAGQSLSNGGGSLELVLGLVALVVAVILLSPLCLAVLGRLGRHAPIAVRLALRDLARYRARSSSALAAISLGVLIAMLVCVLSAQRFGNVLDYAGPNLASNQLIIYTPNGPGGPGNGGPSGPVTGGSLQSMAKSARVIATALGSHDIVQLESTSATLRHAAPGRSFGGQVYVATPQLLRAFGISASAVDPAADILTMRPGLSGLSHMQLVYGNSSGGNGNGPQGGAPGTYPCPRSDCRADPVIQEVSALPSGTSAPNTVITEHAVRQLGLQASTSGWLIQTPHPPTAAQITNARLTAATTGLTIETKNSIPASSTIINWATVFGILLALGILAMSVGLIRSEAASDLRILTATGASSTTRRSITAATAGALGLAGAVLGTAGAYAGAVAWSWDNKLEGLGALSSVPTENLLIILIGMPLIAAVVGWLLAGREPAAVAHQPIE